MCRSARRGWCRPRSSSNSCSSLAGWQAALLNPRLYLLAGAYAACFGMELVVANIVSLYLFNQFGLSLTVAGLLGECCAGAAGWRGPGQHCGCWCRGLSTTACKGCLRMLSLSVRGAAWRCRSWWLHCWVGPVGGWLGREDLASMCTHVDVAAVVRVAHNLLAACACEY